ncbi:MAG: hypothetical protein IPP39_16715 [Chitinophagaceae bacterium]|nr:hypothetical protein [Chitinophagaceae bacterium]
MIATTSATHSGSTHNTITANGGTNQNNNDMLTATTNRPALPAAAVTNLQNFIQRFTASYCWGFCPFGIGVGQSWGQLKHEC